MAADTTATERLMSWKLVLGLTAALAWAAAPAAAQSKKDTLSVDLPGDAATLDPHCSGTPTATRSTATSSTTC